LYRLSVDQISHAFGYSCKSDDDLSRRNRKQVFNSREGGGTKTNKETGQKQKFRIWNPEASNNNHNNKTKNYLPESLWQILAESPARDVQSSTGGRVPTP
jgi:hypothetical protein